MDNPEDKISEFYAAFVSGNLKEDPRRYFTELQSLFDQVDTKTKIHIIEIILSIIAGKSYNNVNEDENEVDSFADLTWIRNKVSKILNKSPESIEDHNLIASELTSIQDMMNWLEEKLLTIKEESILSTFYLFFSSYWENLEHTQPKIFQKLYHIHLKLLNNVKYAKWNALDRLNQERFTNSYKIPPH